MSVATGTAQALPIPGAPAPMASVTATGTIMPPIAAKIGRMALRGSRSSPRTSSCLSSSPTTTKKTVSRPSVAHCSQVRCACSAAGPNGVLERLVAVLPRRVRDDQRERRGPEQDQATDLLGTQELDDVRCGFADSSPSPCPP